MIYFAYYASTQRRWTLQEKHDLVELGQKWKQETVPSRKQSE